MHARYNHNNIKYFKTVACTPTYKREMSTSAFRSSSSRLPRDISILCRTHPLLKLQTRTFSSSSYEFSQSTARLASSLTPRKLDFPNLPNFNARGRDIQVFTRPDQFYGFLLDSIRKAKRRIFLASLYIGKEETELVSFFDAGQTWR